MSAARGTEAAPFPLYGALPSVLTVDGGEYPIHTDFRNWIAFDRAAFECDRPQEDRLVDMLRLCYVKAVPPRLDLALEAAVDFYLCGRRERQPIGKGDGEGQRAPHKRIYSFSHDGPAIYAAFWAQYGIDLTAAQLHWWQFSALFHGLCGEHLICKMMEYRAADLSAISNKEQRAFYRKMKGLYALPDLRSKDQQEQDMLAELSRMF